MKQTTEASLPPQKSQKEDLPEEPATVVKKKQEVEISGKKEVEVSTIKMKEEAAIKKEQPKKPTTDDKVAPK